MARPPLPREHGTHRGYNQHVRARDSICEPCRQARRDYNRDLKSRRKTGDVAPKKRRAEHGTTGGYSRHRDQGTEPCKPCKSAWAERQRQYRAQYTEDRLEAKRQVDRDRWAEATPEQRSAVYRRQRLQELIPGTGRYARKRAREVRRRTAREYPGAPTAGYTTATWRQLAARWEYYAGKCWVCREPLDPANFHWDHVKPLKVGGVDLASNLRPACPTCNIRKGARWPYTPKP
jgi:5-methylcytosine-specific restriction endonuclease McrA